MRPPEAAFIRECLRRYYYECFGVIEEPGDIRHREFGYQKPGSGMVRHICLKDRAALRVLLMREVPLDVYVSNARYEFPDQPMAEKGWRDADVIFDIDAKDLNLECRASHCVSVCGACGREAAGGRCESCGSGRVSRASLPCRNCMDHSKQEVGKLLEILREDLDAGPRIRVYFSGNEGFHVHVTHRDLGSLQSRERAELADYVMFQGMMPERLGMKRDSRDQNALPHITENGWRGRFARHVFVSKAGRSRMVPKMISNGYDSFEGVIRDASIHLGVRIDPGVTMDIHRIFRMPGTINGKSGLTKVCCQNVDAFDPYSQAVLIPGDDTWVRASCPIPFRLNGEGFGPYRNEYVRLPAYAAAYMVCKGLAHVAGRS